jgi:hypothetical protein
LSAEHNFFAADVNAQKAGVDFGRDKVILPP